MHEILEIYFIGGMKEGGGPKLGGGPTPNPGGGSPIPGGGIIGLNCPKNVKYKLTILNIL